jgi:hypothetical protein
VKTAAETEGEVPPELEPPELLPGLETIFDDFWCLSTDRQLGMVAGPIPHASILRHVEGMSDEDAEFFTQCLRALDAVYLEKRDEPGDPEATASSNPARDAFRSAFRR